MQGTAIHLVDNVIPHVPVRQWVLSLPRWARFLLARPICAFTVPCAQSTTVWNCALPSRVARVAACWSLIC
jgi:hypothetical protein